MASPGGVDGPGEFETDVFQKPQILARHSHQNDPFRLIMMQNSPFGSADAGFTDPADPIVQESRERQEHPAWLVGIRSGLNPFTNDV